MRNAAEIIDVGLAPVLILRPRGVDGRAVKLRPGKIVEVKPGSVMTLGPVAPAWLGALVAVEGF